MSISAKLKAMCGRMIYGVPAGYPTPAVAAVDYLPESDLPGPADDLIKAEAIRPWRVSADGVRWFRAVDATALEDWAPHTCPVIPADLDDGDENDFDPYAIPADDPADDPFDGLLGELGDDDDDDGFDSRNPYRWSGNP